MSAAMEETIPVIKPILACLTLSIVYVASLYIWSDPCTRNEPATIKKRFLSVLLMSFISPMFMSYFLEDKILLRNTLWENLGLRLPGLPQAMILPLLLTMILFLGPIAMQGFSGIWLVYAGKISNVESNKMDPEAVNNNKESDLDDEDINEPHYWWSNVNNLMWVRNYVVAPLSEEFTFRACMLPLLLQVFKPASAIFIAPLFFGAAHFNHLIERIKVGMNVKQAILISCFQFFYTYLFGAYSAFLFARTGHFVAPFFAHTFCNHMGFPDFEEILTQNEPKRSIILILSVVGLISWALLLYPLTSPSIYSSNFWR